jgi:hypothetical protein
VSGRRVARAAAIAALFSGGPSTVWALLTDGDLLEPSLAAGALLLPDASDRRRLLVAAGCAHVGLSFGWAAGLSVVLPRRRSVVWGALAGLAIAAIDLGAAHLSSNSRFDRVRTLPVGPQIADHVAFGAIVAATLDPRNCGAFAAAGTANAPRPRGT